MLTINKEHLFCTFLCICTAFVFICCKIQIRLVMSKNELRVVNWHLSDICFKMFHLTFLFLLTIALLNQSMEQMTETFSARIVATFVMDPELPYSIELVRPSVQLGVQEARKEYPNINFEEPVFRNESNDCESNFAGAVAAEEFYTRRVTAFVGPVCGLALDPVAQMASHWNVPIFSPGGLHPMFKEKKVFKTLTRLSISLNKMAEFVLGLLNYFKWSHVAVITQEGSQNIRIIKNTLETSFSESFDFHVHSEPFEIPKTVTSDALSEILKECSNYARVFIIVATEEMVLKILQTGHQLEMDNGEYVLIVINVFKSMRNFKWIENSVLERNGASSILESLLVVSVRMPSNERYLSFLEKIARKAAEKSSSTGDYHQEKLLDHKDDHHYHHHQHQLDEDHINIIVTGFHDSVLLYAKALNETFAEGGNPVDGAYLSRKLWNRSFYGLVGGDIHIDENGDKETDFTLSHFDSESGKMRPVFDFYGNLSPENSLVKLNEILWPNGEQRAPLDVPLCGFKNEFCTKETESSLIYVLLTLTLLLFVICSTAGAVFKIYRKLKLETELSSLWWRIRWDELTIVDGPSDESGSIEPSTNETPAIRIIPPQPAKSYSQSLFKRSSDKHLLTGDGPLSSLATSGHQESSFSARNRQSLRVVKEETGAKCGLYKGRKVAIKVLNIRKLSLNRNVLLELKQMRDICHENLIRFIGFCSDDPHPCIVTDYSQKGTLRDLLDNNAFNIDWSFRFSLINDIVEGMCFIHSSPIEFHGRLKSTNCVIDRRLVVKLTDFGLRSLLAQVARDSTDQKTLLWTAPEHLRQRSPHLHGSQKGDVYSFSIVLQEIVTRSGPFETPSKEEGGQRSVSSADVKAILKSIKQGNQPYCRPKIDDIDDCPDVVKELMIDCWTEEPSRRSSFETIRHNLKKASRELGNTNFPENLLLRMEQYANDLEKLVENKTAAFFEEKHKCEEILYEVLPRYIVEQLRFGNNVRPESFECVTLYFSDVVGFTQISAHSQPMETVALLNDIYSLIDGVIANYDVYKVETVNDAYMVVSGLPINNGNEHVREIARMSLQLLEEVKSFRIKHLPDKILPLRIGIHSGPCAAGVIGLKMPRYCLFGDTINTASRMETHGEANRIHVSKESKRLLDIFGTFVLEPRGIIDVKGKGKVETFWLLEERKLGKSENSFGRTLSVN